MIYYFLENVICIKHYVKNFTAEHVHESYHWIKNRADLIPNQ